MSAHAVGVFGVGVEPPPDSSEPRLSLVILEVSLSTSARSAWVIWPIFSARFIRLMRSRTRVLTGRFAFSYGSCAALALSFVVAPAPGAASPATSASANAATLIAKNPFVRNMCVLPLVSKPRGLLPVFGSGMRGVTVNKQNHPDRWYYHERV